MTALLLLLAALLGTPVVSAAQDEGLEVLVRGVNGRLAENIRNSLGGGIAPVSRLGTRRDRERFVEEAGRRAAIALRPFGYYDARAEARLKDREGGGWFLEVDVTLGEPVRVGTVEVRVVGEGGDAESFRTWRRRWPLPPGSVLDQVAWGQHKQAALDLATARGYLQATFKAQRIALDLERRSADLTLVLDTGSRAVMGEVRYEQDFLREWVLEPVPRFSPGTPYRADRLEQFRTDLWKLGYFDTIDVTERPDFSVEPPVVDLVVRLTPIHRVTHQGTLGYGTDTEFRTQYRWQRHRLSSRGDSLAAGFAWQTRDEELLLFGEYRLPRKASSLQYWLINPSFSDREQRFELDVEGREEKVPVATGRVENLFVRAGRARRIVGTDTREPITETLYVEFLQDENRIDTLFLDVAAETDPEALVLVRQRNQALSIGVDWDWPNFSGRGFDLRGHRERAWLFTANEALGSDLDFTQAYLSSRWNVPLGDRWRLLLRGEIGYTDAEVQELVFEQGEDTFRVSLTELPFRYRFFAGGSHSVRGYDYEALSNNGIGSNHLLTASVEIEYRLRDNWSVAAFADAGNAFNDWEDRRLRKGVGVGVRWYTAGFPLRLDLAQARDLEGEPWRLHFTIGSPLF